MCKHDIIHKNGSKHTHAHMHAHTHLTALCPGLPRWASTRKVKPIWILLQQETVSGSGISWAIWKSAPRSRQITTPAPHHSSFYRPDDLPDTQPTASKHWWHKYTAYIGNNNGTDQRTAGAVLARRNDTLRRRAMHCQSLWYQTMQPRPPPVIQPMLMQPADNNTAQHTRTKSGLVVKWIERWTHNSKFTGSSPSHSTFR